MTSENNNPEFTIEDNILKGCDINVKVDYDSLGQFILKRLDSSPDTVGQLDAESGRKYTFSKMKDLTVRCAIWMIKQGIKQTDIISLCTHNHIDTFIPYLATIYTGAIFNAWYHDMPISMTEYFMEFIKPKIIFASQYCIDSIEEASKRTNLKVRIITFEKVPGYEYIHDLLEAQSEQEVQEFHYVKPNSIKQTASIIFSSGTTGLAKGVEISHEALLLSVKLFDKSLFTTGESAGLWYSSMYWISAQMIQLKSVAGFTTAIIHKDFDPNETCKVIDKYKVKWIFLSTSMFHYFYKSNVFDKYDLSSLKQFMVGGAKVNSEALKVVNEALPNTEVIQAYGMTEMGGLVTIPKIGNISVGIVAPNVELKILDEKTGKSLPPNQCGEILFKSPYMMSRYYLNPEATKMTIDKDGWIHSGDLGYYDENGLVYIEDRIKEILKVKGHHVAPTEIEDHIRKHPDITECAVIGVPHILDNDHPMAFILKKTSSRVTEDEVLKLAEKLGDLKKLRAGVQFLDKFPHTPTGKIDRKCLREMAKSFVSSENYIV